MADFVKVSDVSQLSPGTMIAANVGGQSVLVVNVNGDIFAMSDECSHRGGLLSSGELYGTTVTCPPPWVRVRCPLGGGDFRTGKRTRFGLHRASRGIRR